MADPLTSFDIGAIIAVVSALVVVIGVLWRAFSSQVDDLKAQLAEGKTDMSALVKRVRNLEDERVADAKAYALKLDEMNRQQMIVFSRAISSLQELTRTVGEWTKRPCQLPGENKVYMSTPTPLPDIDTETILRNDAHAKHGHSHSQEHA